MLSSRPYLIRALYEWIADSGLTPHLLVNATHPAAEVPSEHVQEGRIVLNISSSAVHGLVIGNDWVNFSARFGGLSRNIRFPITAVMAIYARENGQGMAFGGEPSDGDTLLASDDDAPTATQSGGQKKPRPNLKVIK